MDGRPTVVCLVTESESEFVARVILGRHPRYFFVGEVSSLGIVAVLYRLVSRYGISGSFKRNSIKTTYGIRPHR